MWVYRHNSRFQCFIGLPSVVFSTFLFVVIFNSFSTCLFANPPEKNLFQKGVGLIELVGKNALIQFAKKKHSGVQYLTENKKVLYIAESASTTQSILLYEFASGTGPSTRYYFQPSPFVDEISRGPAVNWILGQYEIAGRYDLFNIRYQFSPKYLHTTFKSHKFAIDQHIKTLRTHNMSQFVLGSFNANVTSKNDEILVHIWNKTSKKSLYWGLGNRVQRPRMLGSTSQHIYIVFNKEQILENLK